MTKLIGAFIDYANALRKEGGMCMFTGIPCYYHTSSPVQFRNSRPILMETKLVHKATGGHPPAHFLIAFTH